MLFRNFVEDVVKLDSCHGCGVCLPACPIDGCIIMRKNDINVSNPEINFDTCIKCNLCVKACSGKEFGNTINNNDYGLGDYQAIYECYSVDNSIRKNSSSGGIVTTILMYLFEKKMIDAALVSTMEIKGKNINAYGNVVYNYEDVQNYSKSIYSMVNISSALNEILKKKIRYAIVGLPCHLESLTRLIGTRSKSKRCILKIGLMDGKNVCSFALDYEIHKEDVAKYEFRSKGWWNFKTLKKINNEIIYTKRNESNFSLIWDNFIMIPRKCTVCNDFTAEYSDISVADAWLKKYADNEMGHSIAISRNEKSDKLLKEMLAENLLCLENSDKNSIYESQYLQIDYKKRLFDLKIKIYQVFFNKYKHVSSEYKKDSYNLNDKVAMFKHILLNEFSLYLIKYRLHRIIPTMYLKFNKKFIFQALICKIMYKIFKFDKCKYNDFRVNK